MVANTSVTRSGKDSCATYVSVGAKLGDIKGRYTENLKVGKRRLRIREADGVHLTQNGGRLVTGLVLEKLRPASQAGP